jgi:hypothetical protein
MHDLMLIKSKLPDFIFLNGLDGMSFRANKKSEGQRLKMKSVGLLFSLFFRDFFFSTCMAPKCKKIIKNDVLFDLFDLISSCLDHDSTKNIHTNESEVGKYSHLCDPKTRTLDNSRLHINKHLCSLVWLEQRTWLGHHWNGKLFCSLAMPVADCHHKSGAVGRDPKRTKNH